MGGFLKLSIMYISLEWGFLFVNCFKGEKKHSQAVEDLGWHYTAQTVESHSGNVKVSKMCKISQLHNILTGTNLTENDLASFLFIKVILRDV